jgi:hypothetical protein
LSKSIANIGCTTISVVYIVETEGVPSPGHTPNQFGALEDSKPFKVLPYSGLRAFNCISDSFK